MRTVGVEHRPRTLSLPYMLVSVISEDKIYIASSFRNTIYLNLYIKLLKKWLDGVSGTKWFWRVGFRTKALISKYEVTT